MHTTLLTNRSEFSPIATDGTTRGSTKTSANSFQDQLSEALEGRQSGTRQSSVASSSQISADTLNRQEVGASRREFAASSPSTEGDGTRVASTATDLISSRNLAEKTVSSSETTTTTPSPAASSSNTSTSSTATPKTPADIVAGLLQKNAPPSPYASTSQPSTDPGVFSTPTYIEQSNLNFVVQGVNEENQNRFANYTTGVNNWAAGGMQGNPPAPPQYETVDMNGFTQWWNQYTANIGYENAPPISTFVSNTSSTS